MNENREADALARWLETSLGEPPPEDVPDDVVEAVFALRPDRAPPPRVSIDEVLSELAAGPLAAELAPDEADRRLAAWLDAPDEDADDEDLEAVFALRPDLAPPPRVSLDDILSGVRQGPLADPKGSDAARMPSSLGELPAPVEVANAVPAARRLLPAWFLPGAGVLLMAALALLVVLPASREMPVTGFPAAQAPRESAPAPMVLPEVEVSPASPAPEVAAKPAARGDLAERAEPKAGLEQAGPAPSPAPPPAEQPAVAQALGYATADEPARDAERSRELEADDEGDGWGYLAASEAGASAGGRAQAGADQAEVAATSPLKDEDALSEPTIAEAEEVVVTSRTASKTAERSERRTLAPSAPTASSAPAGGATEGMVTSGKGRLAQADQALAQGDVRTAERLLLALLTERDPKLAKEAALRLGRLYLDQGRRDEARSVVALGLATGESPRDLTVRLLALQDEIGEQP